VGGINPFGTKKKLTVLMESGLLKYKKVAVNGGKRGLMLKMNPEDIVSVLNCEVMELI
jgi:Cys-tRNA(Pro)/Cys-tRNA(Cys) deacylase